MQADDVLRPNDMVGERFVLREDLAPGDARRNIWLAYDRDLRREVVLKDTSSVAEARAMAQFTHPHVIAVYQPFPLEEGRRDAGNWVVMEFARHRSLVSTRLSPMEAAKIGAQVAGALSYMHARSLVHCDVKPGNIVRTEDFTAKLTDFGSAYRLAPTDTPQPSVGRVTHAFAAPEQLEGVRTTAVDVYALAATVYALVMGEPPARERDDIRHQDLGPLNDVLPAMLQAHPRLRPDATQAQRQFQNIADGKNPREIPIREQPTEDPPTSETLPDLPAMGPRAQMPDDLQRPTNPKAGTDRRGRALWHVLGAFGAALLASVIVLVTSTSVLGGSIAGFGANESPSPASTVTQPPVTVTPTPSPSPSPSPKPSKTRDPGQSDPTMSPSPTTKRAPPPDPCQKRALYRVKESGEVVRDDPSDSIGHIEAGDGFMRTSWRTPSDEDLDDRYYGTMTSGESDGVTGYVRIIKLDFIREWCA